MDKNYLSKHERILENKPKHIIDACVLFGVFDKKDKDNMEYCKSYLGGLDHKYNGYVTIPILGEIIIACSHCKDEDIRHSVFKYIMSFIDTEKLNIVAYPQSSECKVSDLFSAHRDLDHDDACHLSHAIYHGFEYFITLDGKLTDTQYKKSMSKIKDNHGLTVLHPRDAIKKLNI